MNPRTRMAAFTALIFILPFIASQAVRADADVPVTLQLMPGVSQWVVVNGEGWNGKRYYVLVSQLRISSLNQSSLDNFCSQEGPALGIFYRQKGGYDRSEDHRIVRRDKQCLISSVAQPAAPVATAAPATRQPAAASGAPWSEKRPGRWVSEDVWSKLKAAGESQGFRYPGNVPINVCQSIAKSDRFARILENPQAIIAAFEKMQEFMRAYPNCDVSSLYDYLETPDKGGKSPLDKILDSSSNAVPAAAQRAAAPQPVGGPAGASAQLDKKAMPNDPCMRVVSTVLQQRVGFMDDISFSDSRAAAIGDRFSHYMAEKNHSSQAQQGQGLFIPQPVLDDSRQMKQFPQQSRAWVKKAIQENNYNSIAILYCVMGTRGIDWVRNGDDRQVLFNYSPGQATDIQKKRKLKFDQLMGPWTIPSSDLDSRQAHQFYKKPEVDINEWVTYFLNDAVQQALIAYGSFSVNAEAAAQAGPQAQAGSPAIPGGEKFSAAAAIAGKMQIAKTFGFKYMYRDGAYGMDGFWDPGTPADNSPSKWNSVKKAFFMDKLFKWKRKPDDFSRDMSLRIVTVKDENGRLIDKIGVADITKPSDAFGLNFDIKNGETDVVLRKGGPAYKMVIESKGDDRVITFKRPGQTNGVGQVTINQLYCLRAAQVLKEPAVVVVNGEKLYVSGQGDHFGALCFWSEKELRGPNSKPRFVVRINERVEGQDVILSPETGRNLGVIGKTKYIVKYDPDKAFWDIQKGFNKDEDKDDKKDKKAKKAKGEGVEGAAAEGDAAPEVVAKGKACEGAGDKETKSVGMSPNLGCNTGIMARLNDGVKKKYHIYTDPKEVIDAQRHSMFFLDFDDQSLSLNNGDMKGAKLGVIGDHFLSFSNSSGTVYWDLTQLKEKIPFVKPEDPKSGLRNYPFLQIGEASDKAFSVSDKALLSHAMKAAGYKPSDIKTAQDNLGSGEGVSHIGTQGPDKILAGEREIWPKADKAMEVSGKPKALQRASGDAGTAHYGKKGELSEPVTMKQPPTTEGAVFSVNVEASRFYVRLVQMDRDGGPKSGASYLAFAKDQEDQKYMSARFAPPDMSSIHLLGQPVPAESSEYQIAMKKGSNHDKGYFYLQGAPLQKGQDVDSCRNNMGVVLWWGYPSSDAAKADCPK